VSAFIHNPPSWIVAVVIAVLSAHAIDKLVEVVTRRRGHNGLIPILELFIVFVLGFLALHSYYEGMVKTHEHHAWYDRPFAIVVALVLYGLGSMALYILSRPSQPPVGTRSGNRER